MLGSIWGCQNMSFGALRPTNTTHCMPATYEGYFIATSQLRS